MRLMTRHSELNSGSSQGLARSFHNQGENDLAEFNFFLDKKFFSTGHRFQFLTMYRGTDDSSIDPERNSIQKGYVRIYGPRDEYIFGDALVNYSRLTMNQNIKGVSASWKLAKKWKLSATGGVFIDRWGSLFKDQLLNLQAYAIDPITGLRTPYLLDANGNPVLDAGGNPIRLVSGCQPTVYNPTPNNFAAVERSAVRPAIHGGGERGAAGVCVRARLRRSVSTGHRATTWWTHGRRWRPIPRSRFRRRCPPATRSDPSISSTSSAA